MNFIILLICLAAERWTNLGFNVRKFKVFELYLTLFKSLKLNSYLNLLIILLPILIVIVLIFFLLMFVWFGLLAFIFAFLILWYCFGDFVFDDKAAIHQENYHDEVETQVASLVMLANNHIFAVTFWFLILGPIGAVLYRVNELVSKKGANAELQTVATKFQLLLDWIPTRLLAISFGFVSHFMKVLKAWLDHILTGVSQNEQVLTACGFAAMQDDLNASGITPAEVKKHVLTLIDRTLIFWLVIIAIITILWLL